MLINDDLDPNIIPERKMLQFKIKVIVNNELATVECPIKIQDYQLVYNNTEQQDVARKTRSNLKKEFVEKMYEPVIKQKSVHVFSVVKSKQLFQGKIQQNVSNTTLGQKQKISINFQKKIEDQYSTSDRNILKINCLTGGPLIQQDQWAQKDLFNRVVQRNRKLSDYGKATFFPSLPQTTKVKEKTELQKKIDHFYRYYNIDELNRSGELSF